MEAMQQMVDSARGVLRDMSVTQRLSIVMAGVTVAVFLGSMIVIGSMSEERGYVALPIEVEPGKDYDQIKAVLEENGFEHKYIFEAKRIQVKIEDRNRATMLLATEELLEKDSATGFEAMIGKVQFHTGEPMRKEMMRIAKQNELAKMIETIDMVEKAKVVLAVGKDKVFGPLIRPRASVNLKTYRGKDMNQKVADSIILLVSASAAGLNPKDVIVTDSHGRHFRSTDEDTGSARALKKREFQILEERNARTKVEELARRFYPGAEVVAFVDVELDMTEKKTWDKKVYEGMPLRSITKKRAFSSTKPIGGEPGTNPNVLRTAGTGRGNEEITSDNTKSSDVTNDNSILKTETVYAPGEVTNMSVSLVMHLPPVYKTDEEGRIVLDDETKEPIPTKDSAAEMDAQARMDLKKQIVAALGMSGVGGADQVEVKQVKWELWRDMSPRAESAGSILAQLAIKNLTVFVLGALILVGMLLIWSQMRQPTPAEEQPLFDEEEETPSALDLPSDADKKNASFLQMREKITEIVDEDPAKAASLVKRWLVME
ncbi:MAG: flagellar M-ring protein FliF C-terminal domain-containing protein [Planctomycetota bacterium]|jgi:flagellar biosynthesis/type III secretory pathway M-ring protein FliF/YscJ